MAANAKVNDSVIIRIDEFCHIRTYWARVTRVYIARTRVVCRRDVFLSGRG